MFRLLKNAIKTTALREGDHYILNGEKTDISRGMQADAAIVTAKATDPESGASGISLFW